MSFPRYDVCRNSGVEWIGLIPAHWRVTQLKYVVTEICSGGTPDTSNPTLWAATDDADCIPWVAIGDMTRATIVATTEKQITPAALAAKRLQLLPEGTLLYSMYASLGKVATLGTRAAINQAILGIIPDPGMIASDFLRFWLESLEPFLQLFASSNTQSNLNAAKVRSLPVVLPTLTEQWQVCAFIENEIRRIAELTAEQQRLTELLNEQRQAIISHAVTKGLNSDAPMKPSGIEWLGDIPAHWKIVSLKRIADVNTGTAKGKDIGSKTTVTVPYLRVANVQDGYLDLDDVATIEIPVDELERYALKKGDVLMNEGGDFDKLGRGCVWDAQIEPCITQNHVFAVRPREVQSDWLSAFIRSDYAQFYFMSRSKQSTNLASISSTNLMMLPLVIPPAQEQCEILTSVAEQETRIASLIKECERAVTLLEQRRSALISAAVTGQIDVRALAAVGAA